MNNIDEILGKTEFLEVLNSNTLVLADFYASWCGPCKLQTPILAEFQKEMEKKIKIIKIDVDQNPDLANLYDVQSIPTLVIFSQGEYKEKTVGLTAKATLSEMLIKYL